MPIDYRNYPKDWKARRRRILKRAGYRCERCGVQNYSIIQRLEEEEYLVVGRGKDFQDARRIRNIHIDEKPRPIIIILTLSHLDHDEWNEEVKDERLAALCQRCHFQHDRQDNQMRKRYGKWYKRYQHQLKIKLS